jgi:hypothetical protein
MLQAFRDQNLGQSGPAVDGSERYEIAPAPIYVTAMPQPISIAAPTTAPTTRRTAGAGVTIGAPRVPETLAPPTVAPAPSTFAPRAAQPATLQGFQTTAPTLGTPCNCWPWPALAFMFAGAAALLWWRT